MASNIKTIKLKDIWRTLNKIRATVFRLGLDLNKFFDPLDPQKNNVIAESKFLSVLGGPLREVIGLTFQETEELADYFRVQDGRILYKQMCDVIHGEDVVRPGVTPPDKLHRLVCPEPRTLAPHRCFTEDEHRRLCNLLATIASRKLVLRPYFQDYELIAKNDGRMTFAHFSRVLSYSKLVIAPDDFNLLVRRFIKDYYTVDYEEFICEVEKMAGRGVEEIGNANADLRRVIVTSLSEGAGDEVAPSVYPPEYRTPAVYHPILEDPIPPDANIGVLIRRVQKYVGSQRIRVSEFFRQHDPLNSGRISRGMFITSCNSIGIGSLGKLPLSVDEMDAICRFYRDPNDESKVCWRTFEDDVDHVFTVKDMDRQPQVVPLTGEAVHGIPRLGAPDCPAFQRIRELVEIRSIRLRPLFADFDTRKIGTVTKNQLVRVLCRSGLLLSPQEVQLLESSYMKNGLFYYNYFIREVESPLVPLQRQMTVHQNDFLQQMELATTPPPRPPPEETDIVCVLAKIKRQVVQERIRLRYLLETHDALRHLSIPRADFYRALSAGRVTITPVEVDTVMNVFASPIRAGYVDYVRFAEIIEEVFTQGGLVHAPLLVPVQHLPSRDKAVNFLNHGQRQLLSMIMEKFAKSPNSKTNLSEVLEDFDPSRIGSVTRSKFERALKVRDLVASPRAMDVVCRCFAVMRGPDVEVDYRGFMRALEILHNASRNQTC